MNNQPRIPDAETRAKSVARLRDVCYMFDAQIMVLDELIAQVEAENRTGYSQCLSPEPRPTPARRVQAKAGGKQDIRIIYIGWLSRAVCLRSLPCNSLI